MLSKLNICMSSGTPAKWINSRGICLLVFHYKKWVEIQACYLTGWLVLQGIFISLLLMRVVMGTRAGKCISLTK